jgi:hypothetical protein
MNTHVSIPAAPAAPVFPDRYIMILDAPGGAGEYQHGDYMLCNTVTLPKKGEMVCIHPRRGGSLMLVLDGAIPEHLWRRMPFARNDKNNCDVVVVGHILGTERCIAVELHKLWAVHVCEGKHEIGGDA